MKRIAWIVTAVLALGLLAAGTNEVDRVVTEIVTDSYDTDAPPKQHRLSEDELNAWVALQLREQRPPGLQELLVKLRPDDRLGALMTIDLDEAGVSGGSSWLMSMLTGRQDVEFEGHLQSSEGRARYQIERVRINGYPVPVSLVESLLSRWGQGMEPPIDFREPFELPYQIQQIRIDTGVVTIHTGS